MTNGFLGENLNKIISGDARALSCSIPDESIDLVLTDPPFGINFKYEGYDDDPHRYEELIGWLVSECNRVVKPGGLCFVFQAQLRLRLMWSMFPEDSRIFSAAKNFVQMRPTPVQFAYDPVIFWQKPGKLLPEYRGRDFFLSNTASTNNRGLNEAGWHECPRPLDVCIYIIDNFSPVGGIIYDPFMGSGTTGLAASMTGRNFIGFEIRDEHAVRATERIRNAPVSFFNLSGISQTAMFAEGGGT